MTDTLTSFDPPFPLIHLSVSGGGGESFQAVSLGQQELGTSNIMKLKNVWKRRLLPRKHGQEICHGFFCSFVIT